MGKAQRRPRTAVSNSRSSDPEWVAEAQRGFDYGYRTTMIIWALMTRMVFSDPFRVGGDGIIRNPVAAFACGGLATGYCLAGFQPATRPAVSVMRSGELLSAPHSTETSLGFV